MAWIFGLKNYEATLLMGVVLGVAGASFAVAMPQAGRWYPPNMQGLVMGLAGAGNIGVVIDSLLAPRLAEAYGWEAVFGFALIPAVFVLAIYIIFSKEPPNPSSPTPPLLRCREIEMFSPTVKRRRLNEVLTRALPRWKRLYAAVPC